MSPMWGSYKNLVDEPQQLTDKKEFEFEETNENLNQQMDILRNAKTAGIMEMCEATASTDSASEELAEKSLRAGSSSASTGRTWLRAGSGSIIVWARTMSYNKTPPPRRLSSATCRMGRPMSAR